MKQLIDRDERDVEDMRKDDAPIIVGLGALRQDNAATGPSGPLMAYLGTISNHDDASTHPLS